MSKFINNSKEFTLIELLVVVAIIGILASMLLPSLQKARREAMIAVSSSNLKQLSVAHEMYLESNDERFVPSRDPSNVDYSWEEYMSSLLGLDLTEDEKDGYTPPKRESYKVLWCPLDEVERRRDPTIHFKRTYSLNGFTTPRIHQYGTTLSMKVNEIEIPTETISMAEQAKSHNLVGGGSNVVVIGNGNLNEVTFSIELDGDVKYNPNHHFNNYRNPLLFIDGHVNRKDMRTTKNDSNYLWKSVKP